MLNPADSYVIGEGDEIIVLAEDDDSYCASITHTLIRDVVQGNSSRPTYVDVCPGGLDAIRNFSRTWSRDPALSLSRFGSGETADQDIERILFCGWRFDMGNLLQVYSAVAPPGSEFWILSEHSVEQRESELQLRGWESKNRVKVVHRIGACRRNVLAQLPLESFSSVIVGASESGSMHSTARSKGSSEHASGTKSEVAGDADARVITVVMMIQDITKRRNAEVTIDDEFGQLSARHGSARDEFFSSPVSGHRLQPSGGWTPKSGMWKPATSPFLRSPSMCNGRLVPGLSRVRSQRFLGSKAKAEINYSRGVIVGEIVDSRSRAMLSMVNSIDAVVASSELISKAVAMVSEDGSVNRVLNTLFDPYDSEITLESVEAYIDLGTSERVSFFELMSRGREFGTIVLGYLERELIESSPEEASTIRYTDVKLNPSNKDLRRCWHADDLLIVLTPGTTDSSMTPSDNITDFSFAKADRELSWSEGAETLSLGKRSKVRFRR